MKQTFLIIFLLFSGELFAQQQKGFSVTRTDSIQSHGTTYALVVGISDYKFVQPLQFATEDAFLYYQFLRSKCGGNVSEENIRLLVDEDATAANIYPRSLSWLKAKNLQSGDRLVIYFSGHGDAVDANEAYFLACDANPAGDKNNYAVTGTVDISKLKNRIQEFSAKGVQVQLIIDACRTDDIPGGRQGITDYNSVIERKAGELLFLGCSANQVSFEDKRWGNGHGAFTWYLVNGLSGLADEDQDGKVSADELQLYVSQNVKRDTRTLGNIQIPFFCCNEYSSQAISIVDPALKTQIQQNQQEGTDQFSQQLLAARTANSIVEFPDPGLRAQFFAIRKLCREKKFLGSNSADSVYDLLTKLYSEKELQPVKDYYVSALLDEAQIAVNQTMTQPNDKDLPKGFYKLHTDLMQRAITLISNDSPEYTKQLYPRLLYLQAQDQLSKIGLISFNFLTGNSSVNVEDSIYQNLKPVEEVIEKLRESIKLGYDYPNAYATLARIYLNFWRFDDEDHDDDVKHFAKIAIKKAPKWLLPYKYLSQVTDDDEMERIFLDLLNTDSSNVSYLIAIGDFYSSERTETGYRKAQPYYQKSFHIDPSQVNIFNSLLQIMLYSGINKYPSIPKEKCDSVINFVLKFHSSLNLQTGKVAYYSFPKCFIQEKRYNDLRNICRLDLNRGDSSSALAYLYILENDFFKNKKVADSILITGIGYEARNIPENNSLGVTVAPFDLSDFRDIADKWDGTKFYETISSIYFFQFRNENKREQILIRAAQDFPNSKKANLSIIDYYTSSYYSSTFSTSDYTITTQGDILRQRFDLALPYIKQLVALDSNDYYSQLKLADAYLQLRDTAMALKTIPVVTDSFRVNQHYFMTLSRLYARMCNGNDCVSALSDAMKYGVKANSFLNFLNDSIFNCIDTSLQYREFLKHLLQDSTVNRGEVYYLIKDYPNAIEEFSKAHLENTKVDESYNIACCYSLMRDTPNAIKYIELAIKNGFNNYDHLQKDADLANIRSTAEFITLMKKYFPEQSNGK